jgi:hypothetical protein
VTRLRPRHGTYAEAREAWDAGRISLCAELLQGATDPHGVLLLSRCQLRLGDAQNAIAALLSLLDRRLDPAVEAQARVLLCVTSYLAGNVVDGERLEREAIAAARAINNVTLTYELKLGSLAAAYRRRDYETVGAIVKDVLSPAEMKKSEPRLENYPFSINYARARFVEIEGFLHLRSGDGRAALASIAQAYRLFDSAGIADDQYETLLLANYAELGVGSGDRDVWAFASSRVEKFYPSSDLYASLFRIYSALAEGAAEAGDLISALRVLRQGIDVVGVDKLRLRAMVERARFLREDGETTGALEEIEAAVRYCKAVDWSRGVDEPAFTQLLSLSAQVAITAGHLEDAERILDIYTNTGRSRHAPPQLRIEDTRVRGEEAYTRAAIARAKGNAKERIECLLQAYDGFVSVSYLSRASQVAFEILEMTRDEKYRRIVESWGDRNSGSLLLRKLSAYNAAEMSYTAASHAFDLNQNELAIQHLESRFDDPAALLRARAYLRLQMFDEVRKTLAGIGTSIVPAISGATQLPAITIEAQVLELTLRLARGDRKYFNDAIDELSAACLKNRVPNMFCEVRFLASSAALESGDLVSAKSHARLVLAIDPSTEPTPSAYRFDIAFWQARCAENLALCAVTTGAYREAVAFYREAFTHLDASAVVSDRIRALLLVGFSSLLVVTGLTEEDAACFERRLSEIVGLEAIVALEVQILINLFEASVLTGAMPRALKYSSRALERSKDTVSRLRFNVARIRANRYLEHRELAMTELRRAFTAADAYGWLEAKPVDVFVLIELLEEAIILDPRSESTQRLFLILDLLPASRQASRPLVDMFEMRTQLLFAAQALANGDVERARAMYNRVEVDGASSEVNPGSYVIDGAIAFAKVTGDPNFLQYPLERCKVDLNSWHARELHLAAGVGDSSPSPAYRRFCEELLAEVSR